MGLESDVGTHDVSALKQKIASLKARITRTHNWVNQNEDTASLNTFEIKKGQLISYFNDYEQAQQALELYDNSLISTDADETETKYVATLSQIKDNIDKLVNVSKSVTPPVSTPTLVTNNMNSALSSVKLPQISINPFSGNFSEWNSFYQLFSTLIIDNLDLTEIQKFIYLKSYLRGEPLNLIQNIEVIDSNFVIALDTLKEV